MFDANAGSEANQELINEVKQKALETAIANNNVSEDKVKEVLDKFGYKTIASITVGDYMKVVNEFEKLKG